jgi:hypothetical protein
MHLDTNFRPDGNFVIQLFCKTCCAEYYIHACQNSPADTGRCWRCDEVAELEALLRK